MENERIKYKKERTSKKNALPDRCAICWETESLTEYKGKHICTDCVVTLKSFQQAR